MAENIIEIPDVTPGAAPAPGLGLADLWRWSSILPVVIEAWERAKELVVGGRLELPTVKVRVFGIRFSWAMGVITRDA